MKTKKIDYTPVLPVTSLQYLNTKDTSPIDADRPLPFEDFYLSFVQTGRRKLNRILSVQQLELLSNTASRSLERDLLARLVSLGTQTLLVEFDRFREQQIDTESQARTKYDRFIANLLTGEIDLFENYPVLARLFDNIIDLWVESTAEFIQRLDLDFSSLAVTFADGVELGKLQDLETALSDRHHGGRSVFALTFDAGIKVIYKPKDLSLDVTFNRLLAWCNQQHISLPFKLLKMLDRQSYGWQEFIEPQPCIDRSAVQNFYHRAGMMLSLLLILGAKDCGHENVIASGEDPVLIDADSLLCPELIGAQEVDKWFDDSVLRVGFLPRWSGSIYAANALDSSVLGNIFPKQTNSGREWKSINTDGMHLVPKTTIVPAGKNIVVLAGKTISPQGYVEEIVKGFEEIAQLSIDRQAMLLSAVSPLSAFAECRSRFHLRSAMSYSVAFNGGLNPQYLQDETEYRVLLDRVLHHQLPNSIAARAEDTQQQIFEAEARSLQRQDIPYCTVGCNGTDLEIVRGAWATPNRSATIPQFFKAPSYVCSIEKVRNFNADRLALQVRLIRSSFTAKYAHLGRNDVDLQGELPLMAVLSSEELQQEALAIGRDLVANAVWDGGGCNWLELSYMFKANRYQLDLLNDSLYTGRAGVSLFLAALGKISGDRQFQKVAVAGLDPFRQSVKAREIRPEILKSGLIGLGGTIYSMVKVSQFLQVTDLLEDAVQVAKLLTPEVIASDQKLDVIWGVTGAILGLLSLYQATGDRSVLDIAVAGGDRLLTSRTNDIPRAWLTTSESTKPLTGFSHGAAGISLALFRLYSATANEEYLAAANEGIAYERSVFDKTVQNWPDFRMAEQRGQVNYLDTWCHGSTGIGLARLASWKVLPSDEIRHEIDIALGTTQKNGVFDRGIDHLCCGNIGKIELLVLASQLLKDRQLLKTARESISKMVIAKQEHGDYRLFAHLPNSAFIPSFYRGKSGIGYQLLRAIDPDFIPSIAIWE
jgi:type 2 lantibiotic biosynthesis protein LanM